MRQKRINARVTDQIDSIIKELTESENLSISEIITESVKAYYVGKKAKLEKPWLALASTGFIGSGKAEKDLSTNYKKSLFKKHKVGI